MKNIYVTLRDRTIEATIGDNQITASVGSGTSINITSVLSNSQIENLVEDTKANDIIQDEDTDTYVTVEKNTDEDMVRFYIKGTEIAHISENEFNLLQNLLSNAKITGGEF